MPYYAVSKGRTTGVFNSWEACKSQVYGFGGARYKKFDTVAEASKFAFGGEGGKKTDEEPMEIFLPTISVSEGHSIKKPTKNTSKKIRSVELPASVTHDGIKTHDIYVDGASRGNGKTKAPISGYGVYYGPGDSRNAAVPMSDVQGKDVAGTNQRAELAAARHALRDIKDGPMDIRYVVKTDSRYTIDAITKWSKNWERNGWKTAANKDVLNRDLIEESVALYKEISKIYEAKGWGPLKFEHVRGHQGIVGNEMADSLANQGADIMQRLYR
ncbi:hypothetical protein CAAN1_21S00320 [[Candida] anglica]